MANDALSESGSLTPAYVAARDQLNVSAVAERGHQLIHTFGTIHGAMSAVEQIRPTLPRTSVASVDAAEGLDEFDRCDAIDRDLPALERRVGQADAAVASALTPHAFRGHEVAGKPVVVALVGPFEHKTAKLTGELQRTMELLEAIHELLAKLTSGKHGLDPDAVDGARAVLARWSGRPLDLAFLRAAVGPLWNLLDTAAGGPLSTRPTELMSAASQQAKETGWLGDVGRFDLQAADNHLAIGGREMAEQVIRDLYTADPDTRAHLLMQIKQRGQLDALCSAVGWAQVKELHESLGHGFADIKHALQPYFLGKRKFGPSLDSEWESHDRSLHGYVGRLGTVGKGVNLVVDLATFGFHSPYGQALDARSHGITSESESQNAKAHAAMRTVATTVVSAATGGMADKLVRGGATTVSLGRAVAGGAAAGTVGGGTTVATADVYNHYIAGTQDGASSVQDYVAAMLLGGAGGAALGGIAKAVSRKSSMPAPEETAYLEPPSTGPYREPSPLLGSASAKAGLDLRALTTAQRDLLEAGQAALAKGDHRAAVTHFDDLVASGASKQTVDAMEAELARSMGKTAPSVYREPKAILPNGKEIPPSAYGGELFHGTDKIPPDIAFAKGFPGRGGNTKLLDHVMQGGDSAFRGTARYIGNSESGGPIAWAEDGGWVYKIDGTPSWDLNAELQGRVSRPDGTFTGNPMPGEHEQAVLANIPRERIVGAMRVSEVDGKLSYGPMIPNPNYRAQR